MRTTLGGARTWLPAGLRHIIAASIVSVESDSTMAEREANTPSRVWRTSNSKSWGRRRQDAAGSDGTASAPTKSDTSSNDGVPGGASESDVDTPVILIDAAGRQSISVGSCRMHLPAAMADESALSDKPRLSSLSRRGSGRSTEDGSSVLELPKAQRSLLSWLRDILAHAAKLLLPGASASSTTENFSASAQLPEAMPSTHAYAAGSIEGDATGSRPNSGPTTPRLQRPEPARLSFLVISEALVIRRGGGGGETWGTAASAGARSGDGSPVQHATPSAAMRSLLRDFIRW